MYWKNRMAKVLASFITGYSGGIGLYFPISAINQLTIDLNTMLFYPSISGMIVALPQLAKVLNEYGNVRKSTS